jgi:hypothetical protein
MKYCVHYHKNSPFRYAAEVAELEILFRPEDTSLPAFIQEHSNQTIILSITKEQIENAAMVKRLAAIGKEFSNVKMRLPALPKTTLTSPYVDAVAAFKEANIPYFFMNYIDSWDLLQGILALDPSDIYIVNELGFSLKQIREITKEKHIQIRCFANFAQSNWAGTAPCRTFFIRPDDVEFYEQYVDVLQFMGDEKNFSTYYCIYEYDRKWFGQLKEIIIGYDSDADNRSYAPMFAQFRCGCGKRCMRGSSCNICERIEKISEALIEQNMIIR